MQPKISLLMANYNNAEYIKQSIESVLNQSSPFWELIIVDDASTDNSLNIIKPYLKDKRIKLIKHKKNQGYAGALITGVKHSSEKILGRIDADDTLHKDAVKIMIKAHQDNADYGLIYSTFYECDSNLKIKNICSWVGEIEKGKTNLHKIRTSHFVTFKKSAYDKTSGFDTKQKKAVDKDIYFKLEEVSKIKFINKALYYYRRHDKGISQEKNKENAYVYHIIAMYKAYKRRLNTNISNLSENEINNIIFQEIKKLKEQNQLELAEFLLSEIN